jgi:hypothetical protein
VADASYQIDIDINAGGAQRGASQIDAALSKLSGRMGGVQAANDNMRSAIDRAGGAMRGAAGHGSALSTVMDDIRGRAAGATPAIGGLVTNLGKLGPMAAVVAGVAVAIGAVASKAIDAASKVEIWKANLLTITGSSQKAEESYAALVAFAAKTPFDLGQAVEGFTKLRTLGLQAAEGALTSFGNTAAAMGKPLNQMIEAVADAATGEFERLKEFGIKSKQEGDKVKFTFGGVTTSVGKDAASIQKYLENLGNTKFAGAMARQMDTIKGAMSNVEDSIFQAFAAIGGGQLGSAFKEILKTIASGVSAVTPLLASIGNVLGGIVGGVGAVLNGFASLWSGINTGGAGAMPILDGLTVAFNLIGQGAQVMGSLVGSVFGAIGNLAGQVVGSVRGFFGGMLGDLTAGFSEGGRSWSNSVVGILRAVKVVVGLMPQMFSIAISDIMKMFRGLGSIVGRLLSGDLSALEDIGATITGSFAASAKAANAIGRIGNATYADTKGADAAISRLRGKSNVTPKLDIGNTPKATPDGKKGDKDKASEAEKRAKAEADFWKTLQGEVETAKLLPLAAEDYRKQLELQKILGRDLNTGEKERLGSLMSQARTAKFMTAALDDHNKKSLDMASQEALLKLRIAGATEEQLSVEKAVADFRVSAQRTGVDIASEAYKASEAQVRADQTRLGVINQQNKGLDDQVAKLKEMAGAGSQFGRDALQTHGSLADQRSAAAADRDKTLQQLNAALSSKDPASKISTAEFQAGVRKAGEDFAIRIAEIGTEFSRTMASVANVLDSIASRIGGKAGAVVGDASDIARDLGKFADTSAGVQKDLGGIFKKLPAGVSKAVGGAVAGLGVGQQVGSLMKSLGIKTSGTGAKLGGAMGGAIGGPLGSLIGSVGGGLIGGLFKKTKQASAGFQIDAQGRVVGMNATGSGKEEKAAASAFAGNVASSLNDIASKLGATIGGLSGVSVGYRPGHKAGAYRVDTTGAGKLTGVLAFDNEADAIAAAIKDAIADGALQGLSDFGKKAVAALDIDSAVSAVMAFNSAMQELEGITDPVGAAIKAVKTPFESLLKTMETVGASTEDLAKINDLQSRKLAEVLKNQIGGFQDLLAELNGEGGGFTAMAQLTSNMGLFDKFKQDIAAGKNVDQDAYLDLANKIRGNAGDVFGANSGQYQDIIGALRTSTQGAIDNATRSYNAAMASDAAAMAKQTEQLAIGNEYARQNAEAAQQAVEYLRIIAANGGGGGGSDMGRVYNGQIAAY